MARKRTPIGCLFYVALVLLAIVIFLFNRVKVQEVLAKTGFTRLFEHKKPVEVEVRPAPSTTPTPSVTPAPSTAPAAPAAGGQPPAAPAPGGRDVVVAVGKPEPKREAPVAKSGQPAAAPVRTRQSRLFFIFVQPDGAIQLKSIIREVQYADAPLTSTLEALLRGPTPAEVNQGLLSLLSPNTRLLKVHVREGTAYLDFSEAFRFNSLGKEGLAAQLKQVVYSATEFSTVKRVQILIEGKTADYLGPEGLYIGKPLGRDSFAQ
jgi:hypothetical protein